MQLGHSGSDLIHNGLRHLIVFGAGVNNSIRTGSGSKLN